ncbi:MAG: nucleotidyl cyclase domain-containing protein [Planctomycetota bacterium]
MKEEGKKVDGGEKPPASRAEDVGKTPASRAEGVRPILNTLVEVAFLYSLIVAGERIFGDHRIGAFGVHPHPYWLVVLPMAAARGLSAAFLAATCATGLYVFGAYQELGSERVHDYLNLEIMLEPLLFYFVGFVVGEFRDLTITRNRDLLSRLEETESKGLSIRQQRDVLNEANRLLEKRLVDQSTQFGNLMLTATRIENAGRKEVFEIALELVEEHCGAAGSVLMPLPDGSVHLLCHRGWPESQVANRLEEARRSEFVQRALEEGRDVNGFSLEESPPLSGPLVVSPLLGDKGVIEALLCLDEIPTSRLNTSAVRTFYAVGEWISAVLCRLERDPAVERHSPTVALLEPTPNWLGTAEDLAHRLSVEYERTTRYGLPLSLITIHFVDWTDTTPQGIRKTDQFVTRHFTQGMRASDLVYRFPHPGCYLVVLPGTPIPGAEVLRERVFRRIEHGPSTSQGEIEMVATGPDPSAPDVDSMLLRLTEIFRSRGAIPLSSKQPLTLPATPRVGNLTDCVRALSGEVGLAMRNEYPIQVLVLMGEKDQGVDPGLLAFHMEQIADRNLRRVDTAYCVGASYVAILLPNTKADNANLLGQRLLQALAEREPNPSYGEVTYSLMSFGPEYPYYGAFLEAMTSVRPLQDVRVTGSS